VAFAQQKQTANDDDFRIRFARLGVPAEHSVYELGYGPPRPRLCGLALMAREFIRRQRQQCAGVL
jgi:hypothetical protein